MAYEYEQATGILEAHAVNAAIEIEVIVRNSSMEAWAKEELLQTARVLRVAVEQSEFLTARDHPTHMGTS